GSITNNSSDISGSGIDIDSVPNNAQQLMMNSISPKAEKRALHRLVENKDNILRGVNRSLRGEFGINICKNVKPSNEDNSSELKQNVVEFMNCDNVPKVCLDVKMHKGVPIRYRPHNLNVLHKQFQAETGTSCSYSMFCQYIPPNIKKPNVNDWRTCLCMLCLNPQMKLEKLIRMNTINNTDTDLHNVIKDDLKFEEFLKKIKLLEKQKVTIT
ncbi:unnamed protein product, partial [Didymodactylos carnosus]